MMLSRRLTRLPLVFAGALSAAAVWSAGAGAQVGAPSYPDLRALPPTNLSLDVRADLGDPAHHVMYLMPRAYNQGKGPLELQRIPRTTGIADLNQRIYEEPAGFQDQPITAVAMTSPFLFEMPNFARYEVWTQRAFARASSRAFERGAPLYVTEDVSQCIADFQRIDENALPIPRYQCDPTVMGISPGWADVASSFDPNVIDFGPTPIPDGKYVLRAIVDPDNLLWESAGKSDAARESRVANQGLTTFEIRNGALVWQDP